MADRHVTFLLGAGASAQSLPVQLQLPDRIRWLRDSLLVQFPPGRYLSKRPFFLEQLDRLIDILEQYGSFDHYAHPSVGIDPEVLRRDKMVYSTAWLLLQLMAEGVDGRYVRFLEKICDQGNAPYPELKKNVTVIDWNYDIQPILAYLEWQLLTTDELNLAAENLGIVPWTSAPENTSYPYVRPREQPKPYRFFKLNGNAGMWHEDIVLQNRTYWRNHLNDNYHFFAPEWKHEVIGFIYKDFPAFLEKENSISMTARAPQPAIEPDLAFAWEESQRWVREGATKRVHPTTDLYIIGYSFFPDNAAIDRQILCGMPALEQIHIQCGSQNSLVESRIKLLLPASKLNSVTFHLHPELDEFILPPYL